MSNKDKSLNISVNAAALGNQLLSNLVKKNNRLKVIISEREQRINELESSSCIAAVAAIQYALNDSSSMFEFLYCWNEGDFQALRDEWEDVPDEVFIGADPSFKRRE